MKKDTLKKMLTFFIAISLVFILGITNMNRMQASDLQSRNEDDALNNDNTDRQYIDPRYVSLGLKEPFTGDYIAELFPELNIHHAEDINLKFYQSIVKIIEDNEYFASIISLNALEKIRNRIGREFTVELVEATIESVNNAINVMQQHPLVLYAEPYYLSEWYTIGNNDGFYDWLDIKPGYVDVFLNEPYTGTNPQSLFPEIKIIEMTDVDGNGINYLIKLLFETKKEVIDAVEILFNHPLVNIAIPVFLTSQPDPNYINLYVAKEIGGGAGLMREINVEHGADINLDGKFVVVRILHGSGLNADITLITINAKENIIVSYTKSNSIVDVWLTDGQPDLRGSELGVKVFATARGE